MGSSFGAAPGVGTRAPGSSAPCNQSADNYAHQVAQKFGLELTDVTCGGATTEDMLSRSQHSLPPQLAAVQPQTQLVTVTVGGNDVSLIKNLVAWSCENAGDHLAADLRGRVCRGTPSTAAEVEEEFSGLEAHMRQIVDGVHHVSPNAKVVFVDYVTILPSKGSCPDKLPLTDAELEQGRMIVTRLEDLTAKVAKETDSGMVKASALTRGHDVCSADPWVFGLQFSAPGIFGPTAYHPKPPAMDAIAAKLEQTLPASLRSGPAKE
jgi:lysophospholipase L1-like esterase